MVELWSLKGVANEWDYGIRKFLDLVDEAIIVESLDRTVKGK